MTLKFKPEVEKSVKFWGGVDVNNAGNLTPTQMSCPYVYIVREKRPCVVIVRDKRLTVEEVKGYLKFHFANTETDK